MDVVTFHGAVVAPRRQPGAFDQVASIFIFDRLAAAGLRTASGYRALRTANSGQATEQCAAAHRARRRPPVPDVAAACYHARRIASRSASTRYTPAGGVTLPSSTSARVRPRRYDGKDVKGAVVLASGRRAGLNFAAVREHGAAGVVRRDRAVHQADDTPDVLQWGSIPYDDALQSFGFKASPRARRLREALALVTCTSTSKTFHRGTNRTLVVGDSRRTPEERIVLAAHVQEPGANDNASGCGTLLATALAITRPPRADSTPGPHAHVPVGRRDSRQPTVAQGSRGSAKGVVAMLSLDMTGEDTAKTGGTFLIEKGPTRPRLGPPVRSALRVGRRQCGPCQGAWQLPQRPASRGRVAPRPGHQLGGPHQPV